MSSLGFQRVYEVIHRRPEWACERFFTDGAGMPVSVESGRALNDFGCIAFSVSFEEDYVNLLQMLDRARIPLRRRDRGPWDPVIVMGGSCASINPLPMSEFVDVFAIGAAENVLPELLAALEGEEQREAVIERLAARDGFYVPAFHRPEEEGDELPKLNKLELTDEQMKHAGVPADDRDRHPAHRVLREVPDRDVARLPGEVPLLLGDLRHGALPLAPDRVHPGLAGARPAGHRPARLRGHRRRRPSGHREDPARGQPASASAPRSPRSASRR